jgi:hypothetical protein
MLNKQETQAPDISHLLAPFRDLKADLLSLKRPFRHFNEFLQECRLRLVLRVREDGDAKANELIRVNELLLHDRETQAEFKAELWPRLAVNVVCTLECVSDDDDDDAGNTTSWNNGT